MNKKQIKRKIKAVKKIIKDAWSVTKRDEIHDYLFGHTSLSSAFCGKLSNGIIDILKDKK